MKFLFELGVEELPSRYVDISEKALKKEVEKELKENRIHYESIESFSTPRRLALRINSMDEMQQDLNEEKIGPSTSVALKDKKPTKALLGFLSSNNLGENDYSIVNTPKGEYIKIKKYVKGKRTEEILKDILDKALKSLEFERTMKWGSNTFRFVRPIKWIVALIDNKVLDFTFEGVKSGDITRGMRIFKSQEIQIDDIDSYEKLLEENYVIVSHDKRKQMIIDQIHTNCDTEEKKTQIDEKLLKEVVNLVEYPYAIMGSFDKSYLVLPEDLITITMKTHQRYFPVRFADGKLANNFVVIRNAPMYSESVKLGNEKVIIPRLADSKFFFDEDLKHKLSDNVEKLKNVMFQKDMGTIYEKMQRSTEIAKFLNADSDTLRTIYLAKADLVSNVINEKEFTELQGMMGGIYAEKTGENEVVSKAIPEHYMPRFQGDKLPETIQGAIASIADKLDTSIGAFCVGLKPTGSKDPYAIRRATQGICLVALDKKLDVDYLQLIDKAYNIFKGNKEVKYAKALEEYKTYFKQRLENVLSDMYDRDLVSYVINNETNFKNLLVKLDKLKTLENTDKFTDLINVLKRVKNILKDVKTTEIDSDLIREKEEKALLEVLLTLKDKDFSSTIDILLENKDVINNFFNNIKINVEDVKMKNNRLALLNNILKTTGNIIEI